MAVPTRTCRVGFRAVSVGGELIPSGQVTQTLSPIGRHAQTHAWTTDDPVFANRRTIGTVSVTV